MPHSFRDYSVLVPGYRTNSLTVLRPAFPDAPRSPSFWVRCDCGAEVCVDSYHLIAGIRKRCSQGCPLIKRGRPKSGPAVRVRGVVRPVLEVVGPFKTTMKTFYKYHRKVRNVPLALAMASVASKWVRENPHVALPRDTLLTEAARLVSALDISTG